MKLSENEIIELKPKVSDDICKEIVAFANTKGGTLYIGVNDDGTINGIVNIDKEILKLNNLIHDCIKPDVTMFVNYDSQSFEEKNIIVFTVQKGTSRPYYLSSKGLKSNGVYVRNGSSCDPASDYLIRQMIRETDGDSYEMMRSLNQTLTFKNAKTCFLKCGLTFDDAKMRSLGIISEDGIYSNVDLLLSDQNSSTIKAAVFSGNDKTAFQDRREISGSLFKQLEELYAYLDLINKNKTTFDGLYRNDARDYPQEALRETILNCIVHRDYSFNSSTLVSAFDDRIEFVSIGGLPMGVELSDIMIGISICRNPQLASIFYRLKFIEAYGTGIAKIMDSYKDCSQKPKIEVSNNAFKITLPNRNKKILKL